jgi:nitronate monooxygenase
VTLAPNDPVHPAEDSPAIRTRLCRQLRIEAPILCAPMGPGITTPELIAAVSNAGGLGLISFGARPPAQLRALVRRLRELTSRPFGVNFVLPLTQPEQVEACLEERVPVLSFFWGDPSPYVAPAHDAGAVVMHQVGSVAEAVRAVRAGVDVVVAQGVEAGGHVAGTVGTFVLLPRVVDAVAPIPVVAAGGIADARGLVAALALGAEGVVLGTRFLATPEAAVHPRYRQRVLEATEEETVLTPLFGGGWPDAPHRALRTPFVEEWLPQQARGQAQRPDEPIIGHTEMAGQLVPVPRFGALPPSADATGDVDAMCQLAGQSVGLVGEVKPAGAIVRELVAGAQQLLSTRLLSLLGAAAAV